MDKQLAEMQASIAAHIKHLENLNGKDGWTGALGLTLGGLRTAAEGLKSHLGSKPVKEQPAK